MKNVEYCTCENPSSLYAGTDDFGHWDICSDCNKSIEDTYEQDPPFDINKD